MQVFQTAGLPPKYGSTILPIIGWSRKSRAALTKSVIAKRNGKRRPHCANGRADFGTVNNKNGRLAKNLFPPSPPGFVEDTLSGYFQGGTTPESFFPCSRR